MFSFFKRKKAAKEEAVVNTTHEPLQPTAVEEPVPEVPEAEAVVRAPAQVEILAPDDGVFTEHAREVPVESMADADALVVDTQEITEPEPVVEPEVAEVTPSDSIIAEPEP
ncbi:MAG: hypothetical protein ACTJHW_08250, partial [Paenalcaligenes sp.]